MSHDYITAIETPRICNKVVSRRAADGTLRKTAKATISIGRAWTVHVPDEAAMARLLHKAAESPHRVLMQGFFPGIEPGREFLILSQKEMRRRLGVAADADVTGWHTINGMPAICRLKRNVIPSSWQQFDKDLVKGMPEALANLSEADWLAAIARLVPSFAETPVVRVASTSGRVLVDGEPYQAKGCRYWFRIDNPYDLERFGAALLLQSFIHKLGFMRPVYSRAEPTKVVAHRHWTIFDPTTFSPERLVFDGKPTVRGEGLSLGPPSIEILPGRDGGPVDTAAVETPEDAVALKAAGLRMATERKRRKVLRVTGEVEEMELVLPVLVDETSLRLDTFIDLGGGETLTVRAYWLSDRGKLRCQTAFRESSSMNGILNRFSTGVPFHFDNGTRIRYDLHPDDVADFGAEVVIKALEAMEEAERLRRWCDMVRHLNAIGRGVVRRWMAQNSDSTAGDLRRQLADHEKTWKAEDKRRRADAKRAPHKIRITWDDSQLPGILATVEKHLFGGDDGYARVMSMGGRLTRPVVEQPVTVRQIMRRHELGEAYPPVLILKAYRKESLRLRLMSTFAFQTPGGPENPPVDMAPPGLLLDSMLEVSPHQAPACTGLLTHPCVWPDGSLVTQDGLDPRSGLYIALPSELDITLPGIITQEMAAASLAWLRETLLEGWEFATELDRDVAVASFLAAVQRKMINDDSGSVGWLINAPIQSSGKTALVQLKFYIVFNRVVPAQSWTRDQDEMRKMLLAILLEGHPGILFDNLDDGTVIQGSEMAKALTSPMYGARILGITENATVPTLVHWCWTGNNVDPSTDFCTRILSARLDPRTGRPDQRTFRRLSLSDWADEHRAEFFTHALTIIAGGIRAQAADWQPTFAATRYKDLNRQILWPLEFAGGADIGQVFAANMDNDTRGNQRAELLGLWFDIYGDAPMESKAIVHELGAARGYCTAADDFAGVTPDDDIDEIDALFSPRPVTPEEAAAAEKRRLMALKCEMHELLRDMLPQGVTTLGLSAILKRIVDRRFDGYWLEKRQTKGSRKSALWSVHREAVEADADPGGEDAQQAAA